MSKNYLKNLRNSPFTTSKELKDECRRLDIPLVGISYVDKLKLLPREAGAYIINLDHSPGKGTHWVALWLDNKLNEYYFDSFGEKAPREVVNWIEGSYIHNPHIIQDERYGYCGQYVIEFLEYMTRKPKGISYKNRFLGFQKLWNLKHSNDNLERLKLLIV